MRTKVKNGKVLHNFVEDLKRLHANRLVSVILYGSRASGDHVEGVSDHNLLVVLKGITPEDLRAAQPAMKKWAASGNPLPVYFTEEEITDAADVFPIEYRDMSEVHKVLFGLDVLANLTISEENLRHQLEYELRGKLIRLRSLYVPNCDSGEKLTSLMTSSLSTFAIFFRHALRLFGEKPATGRRAVIEQIIVRLGLKHEPFAKILDAREKDQTLGQVEAEKIFADYLKELEKVIEAVDSHDAQRSTAPR